MLGCCWGYASIELEVLGLGSWGCGGEGDCERYYFHVSKSWLPVLNPSIRSYQESIYPICHRASIVTLAVAAAGSALDTLHVHVIYKRMCLGMTGGWDVRIEPRSGRGFGGVGGEWAVRGPGGGDYVSMS